MTWRLPKTMSSFHFASGSGTHRPSKWFDTDLYAAA